MVALPQSHEPHNYTSADIYAETDDDISLRIGRAGDIDIVQTYSKVRQWYDEHGTSIYITDQERRIVIFVLPLYEP